MNTLEKTCLLVMLLVMSVPFTVYSEQEGQSRHNLQFVESEKVLHKNNYYHFDKPGFVAEIYFKHPRSFNLGPASGIYRAISTKSSLPMEKRDDIARRIYSGDIGSFRNEPNGVTVFTLYGYKEDLKETAEALIKCLDDMAYAELEKWKKKLDDGRVEKAELQEKISNADKEKEDLAGKIDELKKTVRYHSIEDAQKSIQEFNRVLQLVEIEIVGIGAKLDMIKQEQEKVKTRETEAAKEASNLLFQMRMSQEIELAGALARKGAAESALKKASNFADFSERTQKLTELLKELHEKLPFVERSIANHEEILRNPQEDIRPVELADNKVIIHRYSAE